MPKILLAVSIALLALAGCNTVRGAGQDVEAAGSAVQEQAVETQSDM